jgi:hypothetical protein
LQPADKGKFIKDFEIVYYMEDLSGVAVTLERRLASMDLAAKLSAKKEAPTGTISRDQQNFDFYEKPIRRKKHGEDIDIFLE